MKALYLILALAFAVAAFVVFSTRGDPFTVLPYPHDADDDRETGGDAVPEAAADAGDASPPPDKYQPAEPPPDDWGTADNPDARTSVPRDAQDHKYPGGKLNRH
jgi:hypothetical protein